MEFKLLLTFLVSPTFFVATDDAFIRSHTDFDFFRNDTDFDLHGNTTDLDYDRRSDTPGGSKEGNKCVGDKAPVEACIDYFTFAVVWPPGYVYKQKLPDEILRKNIRPVWSIHGLWPSWYDGMENPGCKRIEQFFVENRLRIAKTTKFQNHQENLHTAISNRWFTIVRRPFGELWDHEFKKHGNCATRSNQIKDDVGYFRKTYYLFVRLDMHTTLSNAQFKPGNTLQLSKIIAILVERLNVTPKVDYIKEKVGEEWKAYLAEVFVCFNTEFTPMNCPEEKLKRQKNDGDLMVTYPTKTPEES